MRLIVSSLISAAAAAGVNWYTNTNIGGNTAFLQSHANAITGAYLCCGLISFLPNGSFAIAHSPAQLAAEIRVFTSRAVETWAVGGVAEAAIHSGSWAAGLAAARAASQALLAEGLEGLLFDYEPAANYTAEHAEAYGAFLGAVSEAIAPLRVAMDVADWGILGPQFWPHYQQRGVSRFTSMTPTYDAKNVTRDVEFVRQALDALPPGSFAAGVGSVLAPGAPEKCEWAYLWTNETLAPFVGFLKSSGVEFVDVWRCDIDSAYDTRGAPDYTAPFFLQALEAFLS
jgi:hypothetical protein